MVSIPTTRQAPGPKAMPLVGNLLEYSREDTLEYLFHLWKTYGDVVRLKLGPLDNLVVVRAEHVQHVLVKNPEVYVKGLSHDKLRSALGNGILTLEGEPWKVQRKRMQPTYTPTNIRQFAEIMTDETQKLIQRWEQLPPGQAVDINQQMAHVTMNVIARAMFSTEVGDDYGEFIQGLYALLHHVVSSTQSIIEMPEFIPTRRNQAFRQARQTVRTYIMRVIEARRQNPPPEPDLLSLLMSARDEASGELMDDQQLHDEILITFFAGHETTASLLTWTWYLLAKHPAEEAQLHAELAQVLGGRTPTMEDMNALPFTRMVLNEVLRLYSPAPMVARDAAADDEMDGYPIRKGTLVTPLIYATHRHPDYWQKPLRFYPDHFLPAAVENRPRYAYLPFGAGQRICIGNHFALMEATLILADAAQRFRPRLAGEHDGAGRFMGVMRPAHPILMQIEPK